MSAWSLGVMWLLSSGHYKVAWAGALVSNIGWIYLSFASGLTGMALYSICMIGVAIRGLWKAYGNKEN